MNRIAVKPFSATITLGLELGYKNTEIEKSEVIAFIQEFQDGLITKKSIYLSAAVTECTIVMRGRVEPHLKLSFINYPKFKLKRKTLKIEIEQLALALMLKFEQNRVVIEYLDETIMLEQNSYIDPRITS
ncbi:hypothetical protein [Flavobacterium faecale]|uniref:hypothetical protein n=1 Tax=Flavobacterium faecale TaxID=1355330 RepID=UPI003AAFC9FC